MTKQFCESCGILLSKGGSAIVNIIREKVYGERTITQEPPVEYHDGLFCANCSKLRQQGRLVKKL